MTNRAHRPGPSPDPSVGGAEKHIKATLDQAVDNIPFPITGMDFAGGSKFIKPGAVH
ncbi:hypothetical protein [Actinomyces qiguomingii]|uniref:hypothetical protein n=1 Tax=Actinomyces qiguomingii TaxID=2057800 RepID=UPI001304CCED|nr:hypothetical protein [Actinomyces qiguomingii]